MKIIIATLLILLNFCLTGVLVIHSITKLSTRNAMAEEISPLDLPFDFTNFEIRVGVDKYSGRYFTYHYEF